MAGGRERTILFRIPGCRRAGGFIMSRTGRIAGGLILLVMIVSIAVMPAMAQPIKAPARITTPGVYELTEDARGITDIYGITIECSDVILDGGNHFLGGEDREKSIGVLVNQYGGEITNITVKNLMLEKWETAVDYKYVKGDEGHTNLIEECDIVGSNTGIHIEYSDYVQVIENQITGCPVAVNVEGLSTYTQMIRNNIKDSGLGVGVTNSKYTTLEENNINTCSVYGVEVTDSEYTTIVRNGVGDNKYAGVRIENSRESEISGNTLTKTETGPVLLIGNEVRYASITDNYFGSYEAISVDDVSSEIVWNSTQAPGTNILGGPYMGGNYWGSAPGSKGFSDTAPDEDGFGISDKPYQINEYNIDYLPLTHTTATKAPEDQEEPPAEAVSENMTEGAGESLPVNETEPGMVAEETPAADMPESNGTQEVLPGVDEPAPAEESAPVEPEPTPEEGIEQNDTPVTDEFAENESIMNSSLTNAYAATGDGDLPADISSPPLQTPAPADGAAMNTSTAATPSAPVGYVVFECTEPGARIVLVTSLGTEISLDPMADASLPVPVPVEGLVYSSFRVEKEGFVTVSANLTPYPASGATVTIPVPLVRIPDQTVNTSVPLPPPQVEQMIPQPGNTTTQAVNPVPLHQEQPVPGNLTAAAAGDLPPVAVTNGLVRASASSTTPHIIRAVSGPGGSIFPSGDVPVLNGESMAFIIEPDEGHTVSYLVIDGIQTGPMSEYLFIDVTMDHTIVAGFA